MFKYLRANRCRERGDHGAQSQDPSWQHHGKRPESPGEPPCQAVHPLCPGHSTSQSGRMSRGPGPGIRAGPATLTLAVPSSCRAARPHLGGPPLHNPIRGLRATLSASDIFRPHPPGSMALAGPKPLLQCQVLTWERVHLLLHKKHGKACVCIT